MTWSGSTPSAQITQNPRATKNSIAPFVPISYVGTGGFAFTTANSTQTPTIHASAQAGDCMIMIAYSRAISVSTPAGWTVVSSYSASASARIYIFSKIHSGAESNPTVTATGGPLWYWHVGILVYRGVNTTTPVRTLGTNYSANGTPATIGPITGITAAGGSAILVVGSTSGNVTSASTLSGDGLTWTEIYDNAGGNLVWAGVNHALITAGSGSYTITDKTFSTVNGGGSVDKGGRIIELQTANP